MREFNVMLKVQIPSADYEDLNDLDSEVRSWLSDLGFEIVACDVTELCKGVTA